MRACRLVPVLMFLALVPGLGRAQVREETPDEDAWSAFPEARPAPATAPVEEAPFEPIDYPGQAADSETSDGLAVEPTAPAEALVEDAPGPSARDAATSLSLLPPQSAPGLSPRLMPEPLAVPLLRSVLDLAGAGAVTLSAGVAVEALVGTRCLRTADRMCILTSFLVTMLSVSATAPVGAWAVGSLLGGEGKLWAAYLGAAMGMGFGVIGAMPTMAFGSGVILAVAGPIGAVVGAAIGYELSHRGERQGRSRLAARSRGVTVTPLVASTRSGSVVGGMMGSF